MNELVIKNLLEYNYQTENWSHSEGEAKASRGLRVGHKPHMSHI